MSRELVEDMILSGVDPKDIDAIYQMGRESVMSHYSKQREEWLDARTSRSDVNDEWIEGLAAGSGVMQRAALDIQVGGDHYKTKAIQPVEYCMANGTGFMEGSVIKYCTRWREKGGVQDLKKARHFLDLLIEYQEKEKGA